MNINFDVPLTFDSALDADKLSRTKFSEIASETIKKVPNSAGLVVSIEGPWGSGKTSVLAMIEALLRKDNDSSAPVIVHFNPWLVGEKDALLRHFLSSIAIAVKLSDVSRIGKKVAKEIKAYAKVFDIVKLIPGAEPWASMIKSVVEATGDATDSISDYKTPDIEAYKGRVEGALKKFDRPIVVFIDDIDRLFPLEVFEMVRIIKAVGHLPHVGYVVAWDSAYVTSALDKLGVPFAASYLDKIVQVRMPLPSLSLAARRSLLNDALNKLDPDALRPRFKNHDQRLGWLYHAGLRDALSQPRDIVRVFNTLRMMEPLLRDEIVFADILGLATLSVKAPAVFELIKTNPRLFVGNMVDDIGIAAKSEDKIKDGAHQRLRAYESNGTADSIKKIVHFLFPKVATAEGGFPLGQGKYVEGNISHPAKLSIALQLSITDGDVSIKAARQYLERPDDRDKIVASLTVENGEDFIDLLGEIGESLQGEGIEDIDELSLSISRLIEKPLFVDLTKQRVSSLGLSSDDKALRAISLLVRARKKSNLLSIAEKIAKDSIALSCAAEIIRKSYAEDGSEFLEEFKLPKDIRDKTLRAFSNNLLNAAKTNSLLVRNQAGPILWVASMVIPGSCPKIFHEIKKLDPTLDSFALQYLGGSWDSTKGTSFALPRDQHLRDIYCPLIELKRHAGERLKDVNLVNPARAAWRSVTEEKNLYAIDGSEAHR
jgi:predicted KAP-like P-loop ATPase